MALNREVYEALRYRIITNHVAPGQKLYEKDLMEEYKIGRTPLREILQELKRDGFVEILPKLGTHVISLDLRTLKEIMQIRRDLEGLAVELAVQNISSSQLEELKGLIKEAKGLKDTAPAKRFSEIDIAFHEIIYEASGNRQLTGMIETLFHRMSMYWFHLGLSTDDLKNSYKELDALVSAIEQKKPKEAREIMGQHISLYTSILKEKLL
jgi:GntR family transcriptional regulator, rspAB operon transcriptional repressor